MPGKNGVEVLEEIKRTFPTLPVMMISGYSVEDQR